MHLFLYHGFIYPVWPRTHYVANGELPCGPPPGLQGYKLETDSRALSMLSNHSATRTPAPACLRFIYFYFVYMSVCLHVCLCATFVLDAHTGQKRALDPLGLQLL